MRNIIYTLYVGQEDSYEKIHVDVNPKEVKKVENEFANDPTILYFERAEGFYKV
tara:strand:- start:5953 stop:6114 length:162 start_codon:yes stop_codon:yes gene_type:complete